MERAVHGLDAGQVAVLILAVVASLCDLRTRRIPNLVTFGGAAAGLLYAFGTEGVSGLVWATGGWLTGVAVFLPFFLLGGMGAGDIKLVGCIGAWLGPKAALWVALYAALSGGALAIGIALTTGYFRQALTNIVKLLSYWRIVGVRPLAEVTLEGARGPRLPYALPITIGAVAVIWFR